jgi:hypothetical protein
MKQHRIRLGWKLPKIVVWNHTVYTDSSLTVALRKCAALIDTKGPVYVRVVPSQIFWAHKKGRWHGTAYFGKPTLQWLSKGLYNERRGKCRDNFGLPGYVDLDITVPYRAKKNWRRAAECFVCRALHEFAHIHQYRTGQIRKLMKLEARQRLHIAIIPHDDLAREKDARRRKAEAWERHGKALDRIVDVLAEAMKKQYEVGYIF